MKKVGRTWDDKRNITQVDAQGCGPLYRVTFGNVLSEGDFWCEWCGKTDGKMYSYNYSIEQATQRDVGLPGSLYCCLHCWGQDTGNTDL